MKNALFIILFMLLLVPLSSRAQKQGDCRKMHLVAKKETIYGISRQYGLTESELINANPSLAKKGLKKGEYICIPYSAAEIEAAAAAAEQERRAAAERAAAEARARQLSLAVILPFGSSRSKQTPEQQRMVDFYRGVLLVVDSLKHAGVSVKVQAYDEDSAPISTILQRPELQQARLIIGPAQPSNIDALAAYASQHSIPLVIPFNTGKTITAGRRYVLQATPQASVHYPSVFSRFIAQHRADNIIFVGIGDKTDHPDYIIAFKQALTDAGIGFSRMSLAEMNTKGASIFSTQRNNIIIPSSPTAHTFDNICAEITEMQLPETVQVQMFGFPEWQAFAQRSSTYMSRFRSQFFVPYYGNNVSSRTAAFQRLFQSSFHRQPVAASPRYAEMGHDLAAFFLTCMQKGGSNYITTITSHSYNSIHQPYHFVQNDPQSGYVNQGYFLVSYKTDGNIQLIAY